MTKLNVRIYHNPRCSKSRETLALLEERGLAPEVVEYMKTPPTASELEALVAALGCSPHDLLRTKEAAYAEAGLSPSSSFETIAAAIAARPILLERPLLVVGARAVFGRPPQRVLELL